MVHDFAVKFKNNCSSLLVWFAILVTSIWANSGLLKRLFTEEIDKLIIENKIHLGVHSAKDIPAVLNKKLRIGAYINREDVRDILITKDADIKNIIDLPKNSTLGTSSPRRTAYIKLLRPDLKVVEIRGNIETRIRKVKDEKIFAIIIAKAGLNRINKLPHQSQSLLIKHKILDKYVMHHKNVGFFYIIQPM